MKSYYQKIKKVLGLSFSLAKAEFKLRNEGSYLGILWYLLNPILTFFILWLVFYDRLGQQIVFYPIYLFLGIIMFNLFQNCVIESSRSILKEHHHLIKSIYFDREALIASIILKNIFSHLFELLLLGILMVFLHINLALILWYIPVLILFSCFLFGVCLIISSLTVYFADLDNICNFAARILWLGTPIFYEIGGQTRLFYVNLVNPMYYFIAFGRQLIIYNTMPDMFLVIGLMLWSLLFLTAGLLIFRALKGKFAELI